MLCQSPQSTSGGHKDEHWCLWQVLMVVVVWLWIVPLLTCWMWRLGFTTSFLHGWNTVSQRMSPLLLLADCIQVGTHASFGVPRYQGRAKQLLSIQRRSIMDCARFCLPAYWFEATGCYSWLADYVCISFTRAMSCAQPHCSRCHAAMVSQDVSPTLRRAGT